MLEFLMFYHVPSYWQAGQEGGLCSRREAWFGSSCISHWVVSDWVCAKVPYFLIGLEAGTGTWRVSG